MPDAWCQEERYYAWLSRVPCRRKLEDERLLVRIGESWKKSRKSYGSPRILKATTARRFRCLTLTAFDGAISVYFKADAGSTVHFLSLPQ